MLLVPHACDRRPHSNNNGTKNKFGFGLGWGDRFGFEEKRRGCKNLTSEQKKKFSDFDWSKFRLRTKSINPKIFRDQ